MQRAAMVWQTPTRFGHLAEMVINNGNTSATVQPAQALILLGAELEPNHWGLASVPGAARRCHLQAEHSELQPHDNGLRA